ncbi:carbohydrate sulfotransferase 1-like [Glandiceps talaboti]
MEKSLSKSTETSVGQVDKKVVDNSHDERSPSKSPETSVGQVDKKVVDNSNDQRNPSAVRVLIDARMNSGSSYTGRYFSHHPSFFYIYEPCLFLARSLRISVLNDTEDNFKKMQEPLISCLHDMFHCNFANCESFTKALGTTGGWVRGHMHVNSTQTEENNLTSLCKTKQNIVIKVLRLDDLSKAYSTIEKDNIKVIYLVRDPRSRLSSRLKGYRESYPDATKILQFRSSAFNYCEWMKRTMKGFKERPKELRDNFILVRYEDLTDRPNDIVPMLYDFVGVPIHETIEQLMLDNQLSEKSSNSWMDRFSFEAVSIVQELCSEELFDAYGYVTVKSEQDWLDRSQTLVLPKIPMFEDFEVAV